MPQNKTLKDSIFEEAHSLDYALHPRSTKKYKTLKAYYWWPDMKQKIAEFIAKCLICQQVKPQRQKNNGLLCPLPCSEWKWEHITMIFLFGLSKMPCGCDGI